MPNAVAVSRNYTGSGVPSSSLGKDGDLYIRTATNVLYRKESGAWVSKGQMASAISNTDASFVCPDAATRTAILSN